MTIAKMPQGNSLPAPRIARRSIALAIAFLGLSATTTPTVAFTQMIGGTQHGAVAPIGHEWITRQAALELLGGDRFSFDTTDDPRGRWVRGKAKNPDIDSPGARQEKERIKSLQLRGGYIDPPIYVQAAIYRPVLDAIIGERWIDLGGFNATTGWIGDHGAKWTLDLVNYLNQGAADLLNGPKPETLKSEVGLNCLDAITQEPAEVQYDHYMRRYDDRNGEGGVRAAEKSQERFVSYFVAAAMAPSTLMMVWDGGGDSRQIEVDRNYFLFGRALHLFQDSFSSEHTVRSADDGWERVRQVKSYMCAAGSEQHVHGFTGALNYSSGDVIWKRGTRVEGSWQGYRPGNMTDLGLVATEATKDLWAAFIRTMGTPRAEREAVARKEAETLAANWLSIDAEETRTWYDSPDHRDQTYVLGDGQGGPGKTVEDCMKGLDVSSGSQLEKVRHIEETQRLCLYNIKAQDGYSDLFDTSLKIPFNWAWVNDLKWEIPPAGWQPTPRVADTGVRVRIRSVHNGQYMSAPDGVANNNWIYNRPGGDPLEFILVGSPREAVFRLSNASLFLSYRGWWPSSPAVKLHNSPAEADFELRPARSGYAIRNLHLDKYLRLSEDSPYLDGTGDGDSQAQWFVEGLE